MRSAAQRSHRWGSGCRRTVPCASVVSIGTILFETFYFVSLFLPRVAPLFFVSGVLFHIMLYLTSGHPFFEHMLLNMTLLVCYDPNRFATWWQGATRMLGLRTAKASATIVD